MLKSKAQAMRAAKMAKLTPPQQEQEATSSSETLQEPTPGPSRVVLEPEAPGGLNDSENERPNDDASSSDGESDFDREKAQGVFDDWMISLPAAQRKMLSVVLADLLSSRFKLKSTAAAFEAAWITGYNEKTVRRYSKEFYENKGCFTEEKRGKYMRHCLLNDENLRLEAAMYVREQGYKKGEANLNAKHLSVG